MRFVLAAMAGALLMVGLLPATALAADNRQGQTVTVGPNEVVNDDLYVAANTVDIQGTINGSLIAVGGTITVSGTVTRDVMASGATISIPGIVQGSVRVAGNNVTITGKVAGDVVAAASTLTLDREATIGRDVMAVAATATLAAPIARDVQIAGTNIIFSNTVGGNVTAYDSTLKLDSGTAIAGNLNYTSNNAVSIGSDASVAGSTQHSYPSNGPTAASYVIGWFQALVGFFILGALLILLVPKFDAKATEAYRTQPWTRLGIGLLALLVVPVVALIAFVVGLVIGGWWLGIFLFGIYLLALAVGFTLVGQAVGRFTLTHLGNANAHPLLSLLVGLVILLLASSIPWIGGLVGFIAVVFGLGIVAVALPAGRPPRLEPTSTVVVAPPTGAMRPTPSAG
ncbi:MAG: hypothetical protein ACHQ0J_09375 [Candidatus Dormibacterales bacterium]